MLEYIALHMNRHTGEAFELTVDRIAHRLHVTPQWVGQLRRHLVETGELLVQQSRGRHPNVYRIPWERCPACQGSNPNGEFGVEDRNPKVPPGQPPSEPQSMTPPTPTCDPPNPKVEEVPAPHLAWIQPQKDSKELKYYKEGPTPNSREEEPEQREEAWEKAERRSPFWCEACGVVIPSCPHRVFEHVRSTPTGAIIREARPQTREAERSYP
jgi:hypothetical protein